MRVGLFISEAGPGGNTIAGVIERAVEAEAMGFHTGWVPHVPWSLDALTALAIAGQHTSRIELGTAVIPTWSHHPLGMAQHALSTQAACGGRLLLGIGPSHQMVAEKWYGATYAGVIHHVREYVEVLEACFAAGAKDAPRVGGAGVVRHEGTLYPVEALLAVPGATSVPIYLAALAPLMLKLAGERADGTITWMGDERTHAEHVLPRLSAAAAGVGRPTPRIIAGLPIAVCDDADQARATAEKTFGMYDQIPTYKRMLDHGDAGSPGGVAVVGTESQVAQRLQGFESAGVTDLCAMVFAVGDDHASKAASVARTKVFLATL